MTDEYKFLWYDSISFNISNSSVIRSPSGLFKDLITLAYAYSSFVPN